MCCEFPSKPAEKSYIFTVHFFTFPAQTYQLRRRDFYKLPSKSCRNTLFVLSDATFWRDTGQIAKQA